MMTRIRRALRDLTGADGIDFAALYPAKVLKSHGGNRFDVQADDSRLGKPVRVRLYPPFPGTTVGVAVGARVLLGFAESKPSKPILLLWETGTNPRIKIGASPKKVARETDTVEVTIPPNTVLIQVPNPAGVPPFLQIPNPAPITLTGTITSGSSVLEVGNA
jgi:hypothetical protein